MQINLNSLEDNDKFAKRLAPLLSTGDVVELRGDLGAGKTTMAKSIINSLVAMEVEVTSPTFNIVQLYETPAFTIWHFDLYRLKSANELIEIGIDEALDSGVSLIEWPEIAENILPKDRLEINLYCSKENERMLVLKGHGKWSKLIGKISNG